MVLENLFSNINLPQYSAEGFKIILLEIENSSYLRFAETTHSYELHTNILKALLEEKKLKYTEFRKRDGKVITHKRGEKYRCLAMGKTDINLEKKVAIFFGSSGDYGLPIFPEHLELIQPLLPNWKLEYIQKNSF